jgi:hypothetical protein
MDIVGKLKSNIWGILSTIFTIVFFVGVYYMKIDYMAGEIVNNSKDIEILKKTVYILVGTVQREYPDIDIVAYSKTSIQNNIPSTTAAEGLEVLKKSTLDAGKLYLTKDMGFTKEQATSVFKKPEN